MDSKTTMEGPSIPKLNGNLTPPSSPTGDSHHGASGTQRPSISGKHDKHPLKLDLPPTPSTSSQSTENVSRANSPAPKLQGGNRFYSEHNPIPKVEHFPWESIYRGPVGIYRSPAGSRMQRGPGSYSSNHPIMGRGTMIVESTPVSPTADHRSDGRDWNDGSASTTIEEGPREGKDEPSDKNTRRNGQRRREAIEKKHAKIVTDPITHQEVSIVDAKYLSPQPIPCTTPVLSPPASWTLYSSELQNLTLKYMAGILISFLILSGLFRFHMSVPLFVSIGAVLAWYRRVDGLWLDVVHHDPVLYHRQRRNKSASSVRPHKGESEASGDTGPESVIWLNNTIAKLWPQINGDLFKPVTDMLEDVMQASIPSIIQQIRIRDIGQGTEPVKILSMRWLEHDDGEVEDDELAQPSPDSSEEDLAKKVNNEADQESIGEWACMEITFAFRGVGRGFAGGDNLSKASNPFLMVNMSLGLRGVVGAPEVPIWVELRGLQGTCRLKVQLIPDPPFMKLATFSLMGMPKIEIAAVPLNQRFLNVMSLPVISDFVYSSIKTTAREFCAPKSFTMDLSKMLVGDDTKKELNAIGVLVVHIDRAQGVRAADKLTGKSDCYVTLSYSKFAKTLWSSRIIFCDLNPVWDETAILLVNADEVKASEKLAVEIWDSDRFTVDDLLGRIEVDVIDLVRKKGKMKTRTDSLMGFKKGQFMPGSLNWSVGFYGKAGLDGEVTKDVSTVAAEVQSTAELDTTAFTAATPAPPAPCDPSNLVTTVPPSETYPSGILSIQVHNIVSLSVPSLSSTRAPNQRIGVATNTEEEEEGEALPSAYCSIMLDYQKIYKTRIKPMTSKPFFNAGTERFVRDWRHSSVLVVVRDSRMREEDPIIGVVELKLKDVFRHESVVSRYYPIQGGIGYGKVRISLLFRCIDTVLPPMLLGADIGSIEIMSRWIDGRNITDEDVKKAGNITFETPLIKKKAIREVSAGPGWSPVHNTHGSTGFRLGVRHRHSSPCVLYFKRDAGSFKLRRDKVVAAAKFWLKDIPDEEVITLRLDVFKPDDMDRFMQNACHDDVSVGKSVGFIELKVRFHRGLGKSHRIAARHDRDFGDVIGAVRAVGVDLRGEQLPVDNGSETDADGVMSDSETEDILHESGGLKEAISRSGSKISRRVSTMSNHTAGVLSSAVSEPKDLRTGDDGHSSSSGNDSDSENGDPLVGGSSKSRHMRTHSAPIGRTNTGTGQPRVMTSREIRKEMNRRERGVMQWKGARTLAWVGRNVKDAGRGVKGKLAMGLSEGRGKRVGERGRNIGWGTEV